MSNTRRKGASGGRWCRHTIHLPLNADHVYHMVLPPGFSVLRVSSSVGIRASMMWRSLRLLTGIVPPLAEIPWILAGLGEVVGPSTVLEGLAMGGAAWRPDPMSNSIVTKAIPSSLVSTNPPTDPFVCSGFHEASLDPHCQQLLLRLLAVLLRLSTTRFSSLLWV